VEVGFRSKCLLRQARCLSASPQNSPESSLKGMHG
jgi:hypothetical protein